MLLAIPDPLTVHHLVWFVSWSITFFAVHWLYMVRDRARRG
jgi:hypothetical protein